MKSRLHRGNIIVKPSSIHGHGVFAEQHFSAGETIEECLVLKVYSDSDTNLTDYLFALPHSKNHGLIALGFGSTYNHDSPCNANFRYDAKRRILQFTAIRQINPNDEITINYGSNWWLTRASKRVPIKDRLSNMMMRGGLVIGSIYLLLSLLEMSHFNVV